MDILYKYLILRSYDLTNVATIIALNNPIEVLKKEKNKPIKYSKEIQGITFLDNPDKLLKIIQTIDTTNMTINKLKNQENLSKVLNDDRGRLLLFILLRDYATF